MMIPGECMVHETVLPGLGIVRTANRSDMMWQCRSLWSFLPNLRVLGDVLDRSTGFATLEWRFAERCSATGSAGKSGPALGG